MIALPVAVDVPLHVDENGVIRIGNTRVTLKTVVNRYRVGDSPADIHAGFPTLSLSEIYAVIAYYLANREEVDDYIRQIEEEGEARRREYEATYAASSEFDAKVRRLIEEKRRSDQS